MPRSDILDASRYQTIASWPALPDIPIVHKVNEGFKIDPRWLNRARMVSDHHELCGGYTVLIPGGRGPGTSSIRQQIETYASAVGRVWRDGMFTQLDVESWWETNPATGRGEYRYGRPVRADEILEAQDWHDQLLGHDRLTVYMNPNERGMSSVFNEWRPISLRDGTPWWMPNYSLSGAAAATRLGADVWQWTQRARVTGILELCDMNEVRNWPAIQRVAGLTRREPEVHPINPIRQTSSPVRVLAGVRKFIPLPDVPDEATGVVVNVTSNNAVEPGYLVCYTGVATGASTVNFTKGIAPNSGVATVPLSTEVGYADSGVNVWSTADVDVLVDLNAWIG